MRKMSKAPWWLATKMYDWLVLTCWLLLTLDGEQQDAADELRPDFSRIIAPEMRTADK